MKKKLHQKCISFDVSSLPFWLLWLPVNTEMRKKKQELIAFVTIHLELLESHGLVDVTQDMLIVEDQLHQCAFAVKNFKWLNLRKDKYWCFWFKKSLFYLVDYIKDRNILLKHKSTILFLVCNFQFYLMWY